MSEGKMRVFICTPYTGNTAVNMAFARQACFYAICRGHTPIAPHLIYPGVIPDSDPGWRKIGIMMGCEWLAHCDELWACGPSITAGMRTEIDYAITHGIPVQYLSSEEIEAGITNMAKAALNTQWRLRGCE